MSRITFEDVVNYVSTQATDAEVKGLFDVGNQRIKQLRATHGAQVAATLTMGDKVRINGISPKYLNGTEGTFTGFERRGTKRYARIDVDPYETHRVGRDQLIVPLSTVEKI